MQNIAVVKATPGSGASELSKLRYSIDEPLTQEYLNPGALTSAPPISQLFIPGLCDRRIGEAAIRVIKTDYFDIGTSHIGGVPKRPKNVIRQ